MGERVAKMDEEATEPPVEDYRKLCSHYSRGCSFVSPCCGKVYPCRLCHDDQELTHKIDRYKVSEVKCRNCHKKQPVAGSCSDCDIVFGEHYFCSVCRLYADVDKKQFHCDKCGLCRVGGRENFFHCDTCGYCLSLSVKDSHFCRRQASRDNCPVCMEDLHTSQSAMHTTDCGHLLHASCYTQMLQKGLYQCPQCQRSITDMSAVWRRHDEERESWQMPRHLQDFKVKVKCRDCTQETDTHFHVVGLKCANCGSYNTVRCGSEEIPEDHGEGEEGEGVRPGHVLQEMLRMIREMRQRYRDLARAGGEAANREEEEEEEAEHESTDEEFATESEGEVGEEAGGELMMQEETSDNQTGYEADGSGTDEELQATSSTPAAPTTGHSTGSSGGVEVGVSPHVEPESDQATGSLPSSVRWYGGGEEEESSSEQEWPMTLPRAMSDWTNSVTQSDSHSAGSDSTSWETEEEEVIIGGDVGTYDPEGEDSEENWENELGDSETMATAVLPMATFPTGPLSANAYDAHIRLDQNGTVHHDPPSPSAIHHHNDNIGS